MSETPTNGPDDANDADRDWFAGLSGERRAGASPAAREGVALRVALEQRARELEADPHIAAATGDEAMNSMRETLRQRLRSEGLFGSTAAPGSGPPPTPSVAPPSNVIEFPWWRRRRPLLALAASLLVAVLAIQQFVIRPDYDLPPQTAGGGSVQTVRADGPKAAAERLAAQLKEAGLKPGLYQRKRTYIVDIQLMAAEVPAALPAFQALGLAPTTGFNRIEISAP